MSLVFIQYWTICVLFTAAAVFILIAGIRRKHAFPFGILSGITTIATILSGLFYAVPLTEILLLLLTFVLLACLPFGKGESV